MRRPILRGSLRSHFRMRGCSLAAVIASAAKQSRQPWLDCFVALLLAMTCFRSPGAAHPSRLAALAPQDEGCSFATVIASAAKQSRQPSMDCFVALLLAMTCFRSRGAAHPSRLAALALQDEGVFVRRRHCERSEAIHAAAPVDCFVAALLAMTANVSSAPPPRRAARSRSSSAPSAGPHRPPPKAPGRARRALR